MLVREQRNRIVGRDDCKPSKCERRETDLKARCALLVPFF